MIGNLVRTSIAVLSNLEALVVIRIALNFFHRKRFSVEVSRRQYDTTPAIAPYGIGIGNTFSLKNLFEANTKLYNFYLSSAMSQTNKLRTPRAKWYLRVCSHLQHSCMFGVRTRHPPTPRGLQLYASTLEHRTYSTAGGMSRGLYSSIQGV